MALFFTDVEDLLHDTIVRCPPSKVNASTQELLSDWGVGVRSPPPCISQASRNRAEHVTSAFTVLPACFVA